MFTSNKIIKYIFAVLAVFLFSTTPLFAYTVSLTADPGGSVSFGGLTGGTVSGSYTGSTRTYIRAVPDSGKTFSGWTGTLAGKPATINETLATNISSVAMFTTVSASTRSINNKCVQRVLTFNVTSARPENGVQATVTKAQIYVLESSSFDFTVQDTSGYLASSPNQAFYYAYNASTVGAGVYLGSNAAFAGNTNYLSLGSATLTSDVHYSCASSATTHTVSFRSNLPASVSTTLLGAGTYANHSNVTLTAYTPLNYRLVSFTGNCGAGSTGYDGSGASYSILSTVTSTVSPTSYTIQDITASCYITANYVYVPPDSNRLFTVTLSAENNGTVTLDGSSGGVVSKTVSAGTVVSISANPSSGYSFYSWTEGLLGQPSTISLTVDKDYSSMATFASTSVSAGTGDGNIAQVLNVRAFPVNGAGFFTYCSQNHSFPSDIGGGCGYLYNNNDVLAIPVSANNGWRFTGWTGNLASTTMDKLNAGTIFVAGEFKNITDPYITANFIFDGTAQTAGGVTYEETIASSPTAILTESVLTSYVNYDGSWDVSPYNIDNVCVRQVVTFRATRASNFLTALFNDEYLYHLYLLNGSEFDLSRSGNFYTFKSDPSNMLIRANDSVLAPGDYTSTQKVGSFGTQASIFTDVSNTFTFKDLELVSNDGYSCAAKNASYAGSLSPLYMGTHPNIQSSIVGYANYPIFGGGSLVTTNVWDPFNATSTDDDLTITAGYNFDYQHTFRRFKCDTALQGINNAGVYCASTFSNVVDRNDLWNSYNYMWVYSSEPIKSFYHEQIANPEEVYKDGEDPVYGLVYFPSDQSILVSGSSTISSSLFTNDELAASTSTTQIHRSSLPFYATRINFTSCRWYDSATQFYNSSGATYTACSGIPYYSVPGTSPYTRDFYNILYPGLKNGLMLDVSDRDYDGEVLYYGFYLTSSGQYTVKPTSDVKKVFNSFSAGSILTLLDIDKIPPTGTSTPKVFVNYNDCYATSTNDGYYETVPGYWSTIYTATSTVNATSTGGTITKVGSDWLHTFTSSGAFTTNAVGGYLRYLVAGAGGEGGSVNAGYQVGGGGAAGEVKASSTYLIATSTYSITVGATTTTNGGSSSFGSVVTSGGGNVGESNNTGSNGGNNSSYNGGTGSGYDAGGGAGSTGNGSTLLNGGAATSNDITGSSYNYGGGGWGGTNNCSSAPTNGGGYGGDGNCVYGRSGGNATTYGSGGGGAGMGSSGSYSGGDGFNGVVILRVAPATITIPGYYSDVYTATSSLYHATSTNPFYCATSTVDVYSVGAGTTTIITDYSKLFSFSADSYSVRFNSTSVGYRSLSEMQKSIESRFSLASCSVTTTTFISNLLCLVKNSFINTFIWAFLPSAETFRSFNNNINSIVENTGSPFSLIFSIPLRFASYSDLSWSPSTSTPLTLGFSTSSKVTFIAPATSTTAIFSNSDYMINQWLDMLLSLVLVVIISMAAISLIL